MNFLSLKKGLFPSLWSGVSTLTSWIYLSYIIKHYSLAFKYLKTVRWSEVYRKEFPPNSYNCSVEGTCFGQGILGVSNVGVPDGVFLCEILLRPCGGFYFPSRNWETHPTVVDAILCGHGMECVRSMADKRGLSTGMQRLNSWGSDGNYENGFENGSMSRMGIIQVTLNLTHRRKFVQDCVLCWFILLFCPENFRFLVTLACKNAALPVFKCFTILEYDICIF